MQDRDTRPKRAGLWTLTPVGTPWTGERTSCVVRLAEEPAHGAPTGLDNLALEPPASPAGRTGQLVHSVHSPYDCPHTALDLDQASNDVAESRLPGPTGAA